MNVNIFVKIFQKKTFVDSQFEKLNAMTEDKQKIFLIQEFERILSEINCHADYIMDLFISDIIREDYVIEKYPYRKRKNILVIYRGLLFLAERRFETFMNVTLFMQIIQDCWTGYLSEEIITCLIRAGMVFTITEIWKVFVQKRDFSGNIVESMEKAKRKISTKTKTCMNKDGVNKATKTVAKKSSKSSKKIASRMIKKSMILKKSETKVNVMEMIIKAKYHSLLR